MEVTENNFKSKILNWAQRNKKTLVFESTEDEKNNKLFRVRLLLDNEEIAIGLDYVKKKAEQIAAEKACTILEVKWKLKKPWSCEQSSTCTLVF